MTACADHWPRKPALVWLLVLIGAAAAVNTTTSPPPLVSRLRDQVLDRPPDCPPCFNCLLPAFPCLNYAECSAFNGRCECPPGFGGEDCGQPVCGALSDGIERPLRQGNHCGCKEGWEGINCNVCNSDSACDAMMPPGLNGTCYRGGLTVNTNYQQCDVTNKKIVEMLPGQPPAVTFSCQRESSRCDFHFWAGEVESFYCSLTECEFKLETRYDSNITTYDCPKIRCSCMKNQFLCGKEGSVDITDFLAEEIKGPGKFACESALDQTAQSCRFEEPAMNELIKQFFGDSYISLGCGSGECLHYSQIPGFVRPPPPDRSVVIVLGIGFVLLFLLASVAVTIWLVRKSRKDTSSYEPISDAEDDEFDRLVDDHIPASVMFNGVSYWIGEKQVLYDVYGHVQPGQIMAIMGASGAGKSTFLDILARRRKRGEVAGDFFVNGKRVEDAEFKNVVGYMDQEDTLMPTLTVYETILYSALLRLPRDMSESSKKLRVMETMNELGIIKIRDSRIGDSETRGISGGERRRVSIACELVTSPSILFLDEPTSGLDAYNAYNVVESLVTLARNYNRTVICTIHQPRSNIYALFDQLVLLANGRLVYSGDAQHVQAHFAHIGHPCPPGFNIADFAVDLTQHTVSRTQNERTPSTAADDDELGGVTPRAAANISANVGAGPPFAPGPQPAAGNRKFPKISIRTAQEEQLYSQRPFAASPSPVLPDVGGPTYWEDNSPVGGTGAIQDDGKNMSEHLRALVTAYYHSQIGRALREQIWTVAGTTTTGPHPIDTIIISPGYQKSSWLTQFRILSDRTMKNLYRNPALLLTHYVISVFLALVCGALFYRVTNDISGFQNRMGVMFFLCALLGFGCLTSLQVLTTDRILFLRERANGYYTPFTYFASKVLFDIVPLRVVPPLLLGVIIYPMVGLTPELASLAKFLLVLVLFNLCAASVCLFVGIVCKDLGVASLASSLVMLFAMLFGGLLLNKDSLPTGMQWAKDISFFHSAFEAMMVNEMVLLQLTENKYGLQIDVPGATILSTFGLDAAAYWPDVRKLFATFCIFVLLSFAWLQKFVKEKR